MIALRRSAHLMLLALIAAACSTSAALPPELPDPGGPQARPSVDWNDPSQRITFPVEWSIQACEGDAPFLCVEKDGQQAGTVEAAAYPLASFSGLPQDTTDDATLRAFAQEFFDAIGADRAEGCGPDYRFDPIEPRPFGLGGTPGIVFGFSGTMPDGSPSELNLQYAAIVDDDIVSIVAAAYDDGGCPGRDDLPSFRSSDLYAFRSHLEDVLTATPLPVLGG